MKNGREKEKRKKIEKKEIFSLRSQINGLLHTG